MAVDEPLQKFARGLKFIFNTTVFLGYNESSCRLSFFPRRTSLLSLLAIIIISICGGGHRSKHMRVHLEFKLPGMRLRRKKAI